MIYRELTSAQKVFFVDFDTFESPIWNHAFKVEFDTNYSYEKINSVLNEFAKKQDGVRLKLCNIDGQPFSYVDEFCYEKYDEFIFGSIDEYLEFEEKQINTPYKLDDYLFRGFICRVDNRTILLACSHHILCDAMGVTSFSSLINALEKDEEIKEFSIVKHIEKELLYKKSNLYKRDKVFWENQFNKYSSGLIFSGGKAINDYSCDVFNGEISPILADKIRKFCQENRIMPTAFFQTVYALTFMKNTGKNHMCIGMPLHNRNTFEDEATLGLYMHLSPLFIEFTNQSFLQACKKVVKDCMEIYRHHNFTSYDIKEEILGGVYPYDVTLSYIYSIKNDSCITNCVYSKELSTAYEIHVADTLNAEIRIKVRYRKSYFDFTTIAKHFSTLTTIIESALDNPNLEVKKLNCYDLGTELSVLQGDYKEIPSDNFYKLFIEKISQNLDDVAIIEGEETITKGEFVSKVKAVVRFLKENGVSDETVAVITAPTTAVYSTIYGILGNGCAYLPIANSYPKERIQKILTSAKVNVLFYDGLVCKIDYNYGVKCVDVNEIFNIIKEGESADLGSENLAYVIYTSGSTGEPKGAKNTHRALVNRLQWMKDTFDFNKDSVILQKTPFTFDVSIWEIFLWSICGGKLSILPENKRYEIPYIVNQIERDKVTHVHFVPSVYRIFAEYIKNNKERINKLSSLKHIILSGESLDGDVVNTVAELLPNVTQSNLYGPAECAVDVTFYVCKGKQEDNVPIGKPIDNVEIYILDGDDNVVPKGEKGELCIGGVAVGSGYVGDDELTAKKFISNPFGEGKLYRTGDVAYVNEDGNIVFYGRNDNQIKLYGQRIELFEIENVLKNIDGVKEGVVITVKRGKTDKLVAFYTGKEREESELRSKLKDKLPQYMIPSIFYIEEIPFTAHGKIDKTALANKYYDIEKNSEYNPPKNEIESRICEIFANVLKVDRFGRDENLIELGASSIDVVSMLCIDFFDGLTLDDVYENPTPKQLSEYLMEKEKLPKALKILYKAKNEKNIFILFSYAGGSAFSVHKLMKSLKNKMEDTSFYYFGWDSNREDGINEIINICREKKVYFYAHCAGSCLAIDLLDGIYKKGEISVEKVFIGANVPPPARPVHVFKGFNIWKLVPNGIIERLLRKAGIEKVENKIVFKKLLEKFRYNMDKYFDFWSKKNDKSKCDLVVFVTKDDIFTPNYKKADKIWGEYVDKVEETVVIDGNNHYFLVESSDLIADVIINKFVKEE